MTTPRESAALLARAAAFIGLDSGPMHLAASVGTPVVAIFSTQNPPGAWFPVGRRHRILYPAGEALTIAAITPEAVLCEANALLRERGVPPRRGAGRT
jgi:ADP-heptose:LPS heptosyltransferase